MWSSSTPADASRLFGGLAAPWWVAGGWALDLWLGKGTRAHEDLDVAILRRDLATFRARLEGWDLHIAHEGALCALEPSDDVEPPLHAIWCRHSSSDPWAFELLLNEAHGGDWVFRRDPTIRRPITSISRTSEDRIPFLAPEVVLLFKAKQRRERDEGDLRRVLPTMTDVQTAWLGASLATWDPGHPWLARLPRAGEAPR